MATVCDFAQIETPAGVSGHSVRPEALGLTGQDEGPDYIVVSNHMVQCEAVDGKMLRPQGRMVRSDRYKYCLYSLGKNRQSLVDMDNDPGEMVNLAARPECAVVLAEHQKYLRQYAEKYKDNTALAMLRDV
jgi:choline-sulfatase